VAKATKPRPEKTVLAYPLAAALAALDAGDDDAAIEALIEVWRERRAVAIADAVELIEARRPEKFPELIATRVDTTRKRLAAADTGDPRVSSVLLELLQHPRFLTDEGLWAQVMDAVEACADPRLWPLARAIRDTLYARLSPAALRDRTVQRFDEVKAPPAPRPPSRKERDLERAIATRLGASRAKKDSEAQVLAEIYEDPRADGPRLVYADLLLERGDPRGELISLQFQRRAKGLDESQKARERWLLKQHMKTWLRGLAPAVANTQGYSRTTFERGFVAIADIYDSAEKQLPLTWNERGWATVEELHGPFKHLIFEKAELRGLRRICDGANLDVLETLSRYPKKFQFLEELELHVPDELGVRTETPRQWTTRDALRGCARLPALRVLTVLVDDLRPDDVVWLVSEVAARSPLQRLVVASTQRDPDLAKRDFDRVVDALTTTVGRVPEVGVVPPWRAWPRPPPFLLVRGANGYDLPG